MRLTPRHRGSAVKVSRGHITKQGSPLVRWALVEAIQHVRAGHPLRPRKDSIIARRGNQAKNIAKIAAAPAAHLGILRDAAARSAPWPPPRSRPREQARTLIAGFTGPA